MLPGAFSGVPQWGQPLVNSPLVLATLVALGLNLPFRLGIRRKVAMSVDPAAPDYPEVANFVERNAAVWAARRTSSPVSSSPCNRRRRPSSSIARPNGPIAIEIGYDEFDIDVTMTYPRHSARVDRATADARTRFWNRRTAPGAWPPS